METKVKFNDYRKNTNPTFEDIEVGSMFTEIGGEIIYIKKKDFITDKGKNECYYNAIDIKDGEFVSFDNDEEIEPIQEIEITIKR
jgi:hypothetical protein